MIITYIIIAIDGLFFIGFLCLFKNIKLAIAIIKCAADCIKDNMMMLIVPPLMSVFVLVFWGIWIYGLVYLWSVGEIDKSPSGPYAAVTHTQE